MNSSEVLHFHNKISGVYIIRNLVNGKRYVGSSRTIQDRFKRHLRSLRNGSHRNPHLQRAFQKYGESSFSFEVLYFVPHVLVKTRRLGRTISEELRKQLSKSLTGNQNALGHSHTEETKQEMSLRRSGLKKSSEHKAKISKAHLGKKHSDAHRTANAAAQRGKITSEETKKKLSDISKGKPKSAEHKARISAGLRGVKKTSEHIAKMVETKRLKRLARERATQ